MADGGGLLLRLRPGRRLVLVFTHDGQNLAVAAESQPEEPPPLPPPAHPPPDAATGPPTAEPAAAPAADLATAPAADPVPPAGDGGVEPLPAATTAPPGCASKAKVKVPLSSETYSSEEEVAVEDETAAPKAATKDGKRAASKSGGTDSSSDSTAEPMGARDRPLPKVKGAVKKDRKKKKKKEKTPKKGRKEAAKGRKRSQSSSHSDLSDWAAEDAANRGGWTAEEWAQWRSWHLGGLYASPASCHMYIIDIYIYMCICICIYICVYVYVYVYMYILNLEMGQYTIYIYIHIYIYRNIYRNTTGMQRFLAQVPRVQKPPPRGVRADWLQAQERGTPPALASLAAARCPSAEPGRCEWAEASWMAATAALAAYKGDQQVRPTAHKATGGFGRA